MKNIMVQGTSSGAGKSVVAAALCRILSDMGYAVAPFKSQNMSRYSYALPGGRLEVASAQAVQAAAARCDVTHEMNPVLLKPRGDGTSAVYVDGRMHGVMDAPSYYDGFALGAGLAAASRALQSLMERFEVVVLEGAGSPAEVNLARYDIANMRMAHLAGDAPVLITCDVDRGGAFASLAGTMRLLPNDDARLVRGFILNKFRGDASILEPGYAILRDVTGVPVVGTVPMIDGMGIPDEDSLDRRPGSRRWDSGAEPPGLQGELDRLAGHVRDNVDMDAVVKMISEGE